MSLILDALKKAEKENPSQSTSRSLLSNPIVSDRPPSSTKRTLFLFILLLVSLGLFVTLRTFKKPPPPGVPQPIATIFSQSKNQDPAQMKQTAAKAFEEGKLPESQILWERLTLLLPTDAEVYNNLGLVLKKSNKKQEAYQAYNRALALKKDYPEALNNLGVLLLLDGVKGEARGNFEKAMGLDKNYADPHFNVALVFEQEGNTKEAIHQYRQFLDLSPLAGDDLKKRILSKIERLEKP